MKSPRQHLHAGQTTPVLTLLCIVALGGLAQAQTQTAQAHAQTPKQSTNQVTAAAGQRNLELTAIEAYCKNLDAFARRNLNRARIFGNIVSPNQETYPVPRDAPRYWEAYPTRKARESAPKGSDSYDGADVWLRNGKVVVAQVEPNRYFYGGERVVTYYFRADGSLAKMRLKFFDYGVDGDVVKETIYDVKGSVLQTRIQCIHIAENRRRSVVNCSRILPGSNQDAPAYRRVEELPFNDLLKTE